MKSFEYGDEELGNKAIAYTISSMILGVSFLTLPRNVADATQYFNGWLSIAIAGVLFISLGYLTAKVAGYYPQKNFYEISKSLVPKPIAAALTLGVGLSFLAAVSFELRAIGNISRHYMFDRTPLEAISLVFYLVVIYAVSGSRAAIIRLNLMFLPIILLVIVMVQFMNIGFFEVTNLRPFLTNDWKGTLKGTLHSSLAFVGYTIIWFYVSYMNKPKEAAKMTALGIAIPSILYLIIYTFSVAVFTLEGTREIMYPTIEIAKEIEVPGGFFERFESIFFVVYIMTILNTTAMSFDAGLIAIMSIFSKLQKMKLIFILSPILFVIAMIPHNPRQLENYGEGLAMAGLFYGGLLPIVYYLLHKWKRGKKQNDETSY